MTDTSSNIKSSLGSLDQATDKKRGSVTGDN